MGNNHGIHHVHHPNNKSKIRQNNSKVDLHQKTSQGEHLSPMEKLGKVRQFKNTFTAMFLLDCFYFVYGFSL